MGRARSRTVNKTPHQTPGLGIATVPNGITAVGFLTTVYGALYVNQAWGLGLMLVGRLFDILDGYTARHLQQVSQAGIMLDALADKISGLVIMVAEWHYGLAPRFIIAIIFFQNLANSLISLVAVQTGISKRLLPSKAGKHAMFFQVSALVLYATAHQVHIYSLYHLLIWLAALLAAIGVLWYGVLASIGYLRDFWRAYQRSGHSTL